MTASGRPWWGRDPQRTATNVGYPAIREAQIRHISSVNTTVNEVRHAPQ
jgi:hypothetical protein